MTRVNLNEPRRNRRDNASSPFRTIPNFGQLSQHEMFANWLEFVPAYAPCRGVYFLRSSYGLPVQMEICAHRGVIKSGE